MLGDLDKLRFRHTRLGSAQGSSSQAIDRIKWSQENIAELRARLFSNTTLLKTFIASCTHADTCSRAEMLSAMEEIKNLINASGLRRKYSALSLLSIASFLRV
ncbi:hypothetical protein L211DRAFT_660626 [Terfezia boudieri ATCC MYA-4762]|uniref:Uncharacterized protein n=1 Tax=Terfezia boudieri ATCC MYA-4762 TaxID=1051890 RepID=A0A3N4LVF2_9PEZI|nr:hypothetical protein L211DRAFT_660626 [Terfezia boudieri ATCC MYA-4762]